LTRKRDDHGYGFFDGDAIEPREPATAFVVPVDAGWEARWAAAISDRISAALLATGQHRPEEPPPVPERPRRTHCITCRAELEEGVEYDHGDTCHACAPWMRRPVTRWKETR
jgi:hypothetical protein